MLDPRMEVADVARLYQQAAADHALVEIELDTQQLRAITDEEAAAIMAGSEWSLQGDMHIDLHAENYATELNDSLEALLRLSWPVWKGQKSQ